MKEENLIEVIRLLTVVAVVVVLAKGQQPYAVVAFAVESISELRLL